MKIFRRAALSALFLSGCSFLSPAGAEEVRKAAGLPPIKAADVPGIANTAGIEPPGPAQGATAPADAAPPVIITVIGIRFTEVGWGPLEPKQFIRLLSLFFPKKTLDEEALKKSFAEYNKQFDFLYEGGDFQPVQNEPRMPDDCIDTHLTKLPEFEANKATIIPFPWSRDPEDTNKVVPRFVEKLAGVYDAYKGTGRPIYILAHSWGTVLMHETMHRLAKTRPDVRIDKFITIGSPLVPGNAVIKLFMAVEVMGEQIQKAVTKPAILSHWKNIWAGRDPFSNAIDAADENVQIDEKVEKVESLLLKLILHDSSLRKLAKQDFFRVINHADWHAAYIYDFDASLKSINKDIAVVVFRPLVAPQVLVTKPR